MNLVVIKYLLLIGAVLTSTAIVAGPLNPQNLVNTPQQEGELAADSIYQFGTEVFYKEIDKPGNEYMKSSVEGYSQALLPTDEMEATFRERWATGVSRFLAGYRGCSEAALELAGVPEMAGAKEKAAVCTKIRSSREEMIRGAEYLAAAKASATPGSSQGFTIGMVLPRVQQITSSAQDAEIACMQAVLADRQGDAEGFSRYLKETNTHVREMRRIFPELGVISNDFKNE
jgi:hypothetical protein